MQDPLTDNTPVVGGGENTESLLPDYGDKGSDSYFTRQNQNDYFGLDPEVVRAIQRNVATMNQPDNSNLTTQDYYPLANRGIEVGSFSGPLGSTSLFAAGLPHIPFALDEQAKQQAKLRAAQENEELMAGTTWDYRELKDKLRQESYNNLADYSYTNILKKYQDQYGDLNGAKLAGKSQEWKRANMLLNTYADNLDKYYDVAVNNIMNFQRQNGGGSTSQTEKYKDPNTGVEYTQTDKDGTPMGANGKKYVPYTSPFTYRKSMEYINGIARKPEEMSLDDIEKYNPQTAFVVAESVDKAIDNYFSNSKVVEDISTTIASELAAKNMTQDELGNVLINGKLGTDKENVNLIITKSGFDSDRIKRIAQGIYSKSYSDYEDVYGKEQAKKYVPSVADIEEALQGYIYQQAKVQLDKVSKESALERAQRKQIETDVPKSERWSLREPNKKENVWSIPYNKQPILQIKTSRYASDGQKLPPDNYIVSEVIERETGGGKKNTVFATIHPVSHQAVLDANNKPVTDNQGRIIYEDIPNTAVSYEVPYVEVEGTVKSVPNVNWSADSPMKRDVKPHTSGGTQTTQPTQSTNSNTGGVY